MEEAGRCGIARWRMGETEGPHHLASAVVSEPPKV